ncbi:hypothetical protein [Candidatus Enterovibrio altilux]|uniref:hypothetical protein n=1 Tax=Candidatus Enterovibrio altilux TaxID=1927128 RepID=UPI001CC26F57|nr:hypothetical protein [Candidatus Enterovibrio luxaltus]
MEKQEINDRLATLSGLVLIDLSVFDGDVVNYVKQRLAPFKEQHVLLFLMLMIFLQKS